MRMISFTKYVGRDMKKSHLQKWVGENDLAEVTDACKEQTCSDAVFLTPDPLPRSDLTHLKTVRVDPSDCSQRREGQSIK